MTISPTYPYPPLTSPEASPTAEVRAEPREATEWWRNTVWEKEQLGAAAALPNATDGVGSEGPDAAAEKSARLEDTLATSHHAALTELGWRADAAVRGCNAVTAEQADLVDNWYAEAVAKDKKA